jgi:hypothetical protein
LKQSLREQGLELLLIRLYRRAKLMHFLVVTFGLLEKVAYGEHLPVDIVSRCLWNAVRR